MIPLNAWVMWDLALSVSIAAILIFGRRLKASLDSAQTLQPLEILPLQLPTLTVVVPAYNEELNIRACVESVLKSHLPDSSLIQVWVADDQSSDRTAEIAEALAKEDARVTLVRVPPRPQDQIWRGKNWACAYVADQIPPSEYLLFLDADVRIEPGAIAAALTTAEQEQTDLLTCPPEIICGCLAEWLVQPIMMSLIALGFNFQAVNDPAQPTYAFAAGPFMLFRKSAYEAIGGHRAIADDLVEDVALAKQIKRNHHKLILQLGLGLIKVRMYQSFQTLWEGWTKNFYLGCQRQISAVVQFVVASLMVLSMPWLGLLAGFLGILRQVSLGYAFAQLLPYGTVLILSWIALAMQYGVLDESARRYQEASRYKWLSWLSGLLVSAIAIGSVIKTETGWGWTWRGRSLAIKS